MLKLLELQTEYKKNPLGMDELAPRFSYKLEGDSLCQKARKITIWSENGECVWENFAETPQTNQIVYMGKTLRPFTRYFWSVTVTDEKGEIFASSGEDYFETGFLGKKWESKWITSYPASGSDTLWSVQRLFRKFTIPGKVRKARFYTTALGLYELRLDGKKVTEDIFTPGWTDYTARVQYQAYDVTTSLTEGDHNWGVFLASGWFSGKISCNWNYGSSGYGRHALFRGELHITYEDGSVEKILSDNSFQCHYYFPSLVMSDIYMGETCNAPADDHSWLLPSSTLTGYAAREENPGVHITWQHGASIRRMASLKPVKITRSQAGTFLVDFGQNFTGREKLHLRNTREGQSILIRHGEILKKDGTLYTDNLRAAAALTTYICRGGEKEDYEPSFTFYGFRFLEISGWNGEMKEEEVEGIVIYSHLEKTGEFSCSDPQINQLYSNIVWGQKSNFLDIPTDCPQRDERYGWTGDTQVFANMASYNMDTSAFYTKYLEDLNTDLLEDSGTYGDFSPNPYDQMTHELLASTFHPYSRTGDPDTGWGDAGIICPWIMYRKYGDKRIIRKHFRNMLRHVDYQVAQTEDFIAESTQWGDWLNMDAPTDKRLLSTSYLAGMAKLLARMAAIIGEMEEANRLEEIYNSIKAAFQKKFFNENGELCVEDPVPGNEFDKRAIARGIKPSCTQTSALLAFHFDLVPEENREKLAAWLEKDIREERNLHLSTGFLGTPLLLPVLSRIGKKALAMELLLQTSCPSWLYPVSQGATTIWERWDSWSDEKGFGPVDMNSFNHYAYGAVGEWFFEELCGIRPGEGPEHPFASFILAPYFTEKLQFAQASYDSCCGKIRSSWERRERKVVWEFTIPCNTRAHVRCPGKVISTTRNQTGISFNGEGILGAGNYRIITEENA